MCIKIQQTTARLLCICSLGSIIETGIIIAIIIPNISMELSSPAPDANEETHAIMQFIAQKKKHIPIAILFRNFFIQLFPPKKVKLNFLLTLFSCYSDSQQKSLRLLYVQYSQQQSFSHLQFWQYTQKDYLLHLKYIALQHQQPYLYSRILSKNSKRPATVKSSQNLFS